MEPINFYTTNKRRLLDNIFSTMKNVDTKNSYMLFDYYRFLHKLRHDVLHYLVLDMLGENWQPEKRISDVFKIIMPDEYARKTPDILLIRRDVWLMIDVSISTDYAKVKKMKDEKYIPIVEYLNNNGFKVCYYHINVDSNYANIELELTKLNNYRIRDFDYNTFSRLKKVYEDLQKFVNDNIDKAIFEELKNKTFSDQNQNDNSSEMLFRDSIKFETIGKYQDLSIDLEGYKKFNQKFDLLTKVEDNINKNTEELLVTFLGNVLENGENNDIYKKYADHRLNIDQFNNAKKEMVSKNNQYEKQEAHPTHHLMIPFGIDDVVKEDGKTEQDTIIDFLKDFKNCYDKADIKNLNSKFHFLKRISDEFEEMLEKSVDKDYNKEVFYEGRESNKELRKTYKDIKNKSMLYHEILVARKNKKKVKQRFIFEAGYDFLKNNTEKLNQTFEELELLKKENIDFFSDQGYGFRDFLRKHKKIKEDDESSYFRENKIFKMSFRGNDAEANEFFRKSGIKKDLTTEPIKDSSFRKTLNFEEKLKIDKFLEYMVQEPTHKRTSKEYDYLCEKVFGKDEVSANIIKEKSIDNYKQCLDLLLNTNAYHYSRKLHDCYNQLMHSSQYNAAPKHFFVYNCGIPNLLIVQAMIFTKAGQDFSGPFFSIVKTKHPEQYDSVFGKVRYFSCEDGYTYVVTNWRRLTLTKMTFMRDVFYSTLSSTMNSFLSSPDTTNMWEKEKIEKIYAFRTTIGYATNQKIGELLMDVRYAYMSAFSHYTNIDKLLVEKFGPPYKTCFEVWIVDRLLEKLPIIHKAVKENGILQTKVEMEQNVRKFETIGGAIDIPSLWSDYRLKDVNDLLDEAFIYVHTMKEPSNVYHEEVKALKTIIKFQEEFDSLPEFIKYGCVKDEKTLREYLMYDTKIGCSSTVIYHSTKHTVDMEKPSFKKIIHELNDEDLGELLSTKAVISDLQRECVKEKTTTKRDVQKRIRKEKHIKKIEPDSKVIVKMEKFYFHVHSKYYHPRKARQKVMETILDILTEQPNISRTVELASHHITKQNGEVLADICIKSQYGAKREFYVVNIGAKATARVCESFFKKMCENSPNEAISIPGDRKTIEMQRMLDKIYYNVHSEKHKLMYVNGDCTKWSAAETLTSFLAMTYALKPYLTEKMYNVLCATFNAWSDKEIQIPLSIRNNVEPTQKYHTTFLGKKTVLETNRLTSTQNFLQGMFNYSSSYKAVCCNNYTYHIWKKIYPKSNLLVEHMEHSDDYVLVVLYEEKEEFEKFRVLQKIMMRLHGFNDSDRKTSCQPYLMEFVSQISFNGVMLYPQIKKSKEINLSLPCTGYKTDMEAAISRVGECQRVGCNQSFLYFFLKLHCFVVAEAYSILPNMHNNFNRSIQQLYSDPIELFGVPDYLPIFSMYCRGNINNYRLYNYDDVAKKKIVFLFVKELENYTNENFLYENMEYRDSLQTPKFMYETMNKTVRKLRLNLDITPEQIKDFWEKNISYKFLKPKDKEKLILWIKCMFYNKTFLEAYVKTSRTQMTMRISKFIKNKIIKETITIDEYTETLKKLKSTCITMKDYYNKISEGLKLFDSNKVVYEEKKLSKILTKCDPTYSAIYSVIKNIRLNEVKKAKNRTIQVAIKTPIRIRTLTLINEPAILLQYIYDKENFVKDKRMLISKDSLDHDMKQISEKLPELDLNNLKRDTMSVLSFFNDLMINKVKRNVMFGYNRFNSNIIEHVMEAYSHNFLQGCILNVELIDSIQITDPFTGVLLYDKGKTQTTDFCRQNVENLCLIYVYFKFVIKYSDSKIREEIKNLRFKNYSMDGKNVIYEDCKQLLSRLNKEYMDIFKYTQEDKKIIGYMKVVLLGEYDTVDEIVNSVYSFTYRYIQKDVPIGGVYRGETILIYTYYNTTVKVIYNPKTYEHPIILINKFYPGVKNVLYNIARKLTIGMPEHEFEKELEKNTITLLTYEQIINISGQYGKKQKIKYYIIMENNEFIFVKPHKLDKNKQYIPFFLTEEELHRGGDVSFGSTNVRPYCDTKSATIKLGRSRLFTLPFWRCTQTNNTVLEVVEKIHNYVPFKKMLENRRIERYLKHKTNIISDSYSVDYIPIKDYYDLLMENLKKQKNYNLDFGDYVTKDVDKLLLNMVNCKRENRKYKQHHFQKDIDIYYEEDTKPQENLEDLEVEENKSEEIKNNSQPDNIIKIQEQEKTLTKEELLGGLSFKPKINLSDFIFEEEEEDFEKLNLSEKKEMEDDFFSFNDDQEEENYEILDFESKSNSNNNFLKINKNDTNDNSLLLEKNEKIITDDEIDNARNIIDVLKKHATKIKYDDDFFVEEQIVDMDNVLKEIDIFEGNKPHERYLGKELLNFGSFDVSLEDILIIRPTKIQNISKKEKINYLFEVVSNSEDYYLIQQLFKNSLPTSDRFYNVHQYINNLNNLLKRTSFLLHQDLDVKKNKERVYIFLTVLYYFLTRCFIKTEKNETLVFKNINNKFTPCLVVDNVSPEQYDKIKTKVRAKLDEKKYIVEISADLYSKRLNEQLKNNLIDLSEIKLEETFDELYREIGFEMVKKTNNDIDDILSEL